MSSPIKNVLIVIVMEAEATPFIQHMKLNKIDHFFPSNVPFMAYQGKYNNCHHNNNHHHNHNNNDDDTKKETKDNNNNNDDNDDATDGSSSNMLITVITLGKDTVYGTTCDNIGTVSASLATYLAIQKLSSTNAAAHGGESESGNGNGTTNGGNGVDIVINAGTCGGFHRMNGHIGDVYVITGVAYHDRRIPIPIPDFTSYGIGFIQCTPELKEKIIIPMIQTFVKEDEEEIKIMTTNNIKEGICTTGNSLDKTDEDDKYMIANNASVKDMEAAAIAWTCRLFSNHNSSSSTSTSGGNNDATTSTTTSQTKTNTQTPHFMGIKVVTDIVDGTIPTQDEFVMNLQAASKSLQHALPKILQYISTVKEL